LGFTQKEISCPCSPSASFIPSPQLPESGKKFWPKFFLLTFQFFPFQTGICPRWMLKRVKYERPTWSFFLHSPPLCQKATAWGLFGVGRVNSRPVALHVFPDFRGSYFLVKAFFFPPPKVPCSFYQVPVFLCAPNPFFLGLPVFFFPYRLISWTDRAGFFPDTSSPYRPVPPLSTYAELRPKPTFPTRANSFFSLHKCLGLYRRELWGPAPQCVFPMEWIALVPFPKSAPLPRSSALFLTYC